MSALMPVRAHSSVALSAVMILSCDEELKSVALARSCSRVKVTTMLVDIFDVSSKLKLIATLHGHIMRVAGVSRFITLGCLRTYMWLSSPKS